METVLSNTEDTRVALVRELKHFFAAQADRWGVEMAFLYGSWAVGNPRRDSDLDVALLFRDETLSDEVAFSCVTDITLALTDKTGLDVNVLMIHRDFRHPMLYYNAIVKGMPLYFRDFSIYADLRHEALCQMEDFSIFGPAWQLAAARRNLLALQHA